MIGYVMVGTNDLNKSITYYDTLLDLLDIKRVDTSDDYAAYSSKNNPENIEFYVTKPANGTKQILVMVLKYLLLLILKKLLKNFMS